MGFFVYNSMEVIPTPFSKRRNENHYIYEEPTSNKSRSAYILLYDKLRAQDDSDDWASDLKMWLVFRKEFIRAELSKNNKLTCAYCGREDLIEGYHEFDKKHLNNNIPNLATIDHIMPLSKNGRRYDRKNCCIACKNCNKRKDNKNIEDFKTDVIH